MRRSHRTALHRLASSLPRGSAVLLAGSAVAVGLLAYLFVAAPGALKLWGAPVVRIDAPPAVTRTAVDDPLISDR